MHAESEYVKPSVQVATTLVVEHFELPTTQVPTHKPRPWQSVLVGHVMLVKPTPLLLQISECVLSRHVESVGLHATSCCATHVPSMQIDPD